MFSRVTLFISGQKAGGMPNGLCPASVPPLPTRWSRGRGSVSTALPAVPSTGHLGHSPDGTRVGRSLAFCLFPGEEGVIAGSRLV